MFLYFVKSIEIKISDNDGGIQLLSIPINSYTNDYKMKFNLVSDWVDIDILDTIGGEFKIFIKYIYRYSFPLYKMFNKILITEVLNISKDKQNILFLTIEALSDPKILRDKKWISDDTFSLYQNVFKDFYFSGDKSNSQADWTFPACMSYHTGLLPSQHKAFDSQSIKDNSYRLNNRISTLAQILKENKYVCFSGSLGKVDPNIFGNGFDYYYKTKHSLGFNEYSADPQWIIGILEKFKTGCYVHLHYDLLHAPYYCNSSPLPWARSSNHLSGSLTKEKEGRLFDDNFNKLLINLNNLFSYLRLKGEFDSTSIVVTSDHGSDVGDWGVIKQEEPLNCFRTRVPYLSNRKELIDMYKGSANISFFGDIMEYLNLDKAKVRYLDSLPQYHRYFSNVVISESILKTKNNMYVLKLSRRSSTYFMYAYIDWDLFDIIEIVKEEINTPEYLNEFINLRNIFIDLNKLFYSNLLN